MAGSCFPRSQRSEPIFLRAAVEPSPPPPCLIPGGYQHFSGAPCWDGQQTLPADPATPALRPHPHPQNVVQYVSFTVSPWPKISNKFISSRSHGNHFEFLLGQLFWPNVPTVPGGGVRDDVRPGWGQSPQPLQHPQPKKPMWPCGGLSDPLSIRTFSSCQLIWRVSSLLSSH